MVVDPQVLLIIHIVVLVLQAIVGILQYIAMQNIKRLWRYIKP